MDDQNEALTNKYNTLSSKQDSLLEKYKELEKKKKELEETSQSEQEKLNAELQKKINLLEESNKQINDLQTAIDKQKEFSSTLLDKIKNALIGFTNDELTVNLKDGKFMYLFQISFFLNLAVIRSIKKVRKRLVSGRGLSKTKRY